MSREAELFQSIRGLVAECAPEGWCIVWLNAEFGEASGETIFDWASKLGERTWFVPSTDVQVQFYRVFRELRALMAQRPPNHQWSKASFVIEVTGKFNADFTYGSAQPSTPAEVHASRGLG